MQLVIQKRHTAHNIRATTLTAAAADKAGGQLATLSQTPPANGDGETMHLLSTRPFDKKCIMPRANFIA